MVIFPWCCSTGLPWKQHHDTIAIPSLGGARSLHYGRKVVLRRPYTRTTSNSERKRRNETVRNRDSVSSRESRLVTSSRGRVMIPGMLLFECNYAWWTVTQNLRTKELLLHERQSCGSRSYSKQVDCSLTNENPGRTANWIFFFLMISVVHMIPRWRS